MKEIKTYLNPIKLAAVESAVRQIDPGLTLRATVAKGFDADPAESSHAPSINSPFNQFQIYIRVEVLCPDTLEAKVVAALAKVAQTGEPDAGEILVNPAGRAIPLQAA